MSLLILNGSVDGRQLDIRVIGTKIVQMAPSLKPNDEDTVISASGTAIIHGLHDHHVHLRALAAVKRSIIVGPPEVTNKEEFELAIRQADPIIGHDWIRAVGYHESVAGEIDRVVLDALTLSPIRVQHRSGVLWYVNSAGIDALGLDNFNLPGIERDHDNRPTGRLHRMDAWLAERLPNVELDISSISAAMAARGVTGVTDATPGATREDMEIVAEYIASGRWRQRLHVMAPASVTVPSHSLISHGPCKIVLDDVRLPTIDDLSKEIGRSHAASLPVAIHCVTAVQMMIALEALALAGALTGDRIEHGSIISPDSFELIKRLDVTVVTNPAFVFERGDDYLRDVEEDQRVDLYRCRSLAASGIKVAAGTDAPFASWDPWVTIDAAVSRTTRSGHLLGREERMSTCGAVALFTGRPDNPGVRRNQLAPGSVADLCAIRTSIGGEFSLRDVDVVLTVVGGELIHRSE